jgi:Tfp pilus assembly protein PilN
MLERINLVPKKPLSEQLRIVVPAALLTILALILLGLYLQNRYLTARIDAVAKETALLRENQENANADLANLTRLTGQLDGLQKQKISLLAEVAKIEAIRSRKANYSRAVNTLAAILPDSLKCEKIAFQGKKGIIEGLALRHRALPRTVQKLQENPVFVSAFLSDVDTVAEGPSAPLSFRIMVEIK